MLLKQEMKTPLILQHRPQLHKLVEQVATRERSKPADNPYLAGKGLLIGCLLRLHEQIPQATDTERSGVDGWAGASFASSGSNCGSDLAITAVAMLLPTTLVAVRAISRN
ncbi:hypothetical protein D9M71_554480 [compost metagenome]